MSAPETKVTAATVVYDRLRSDIINCVLLPAQRLQIEDMAERYGIGVNPIREALNRLSTEGFVEHREQRGFFVRPVSLDEFRQLIHTRCWLDCRALEQSIAHRTPQWEEALLHAHNRLAETPQNLDSAEYTVNASWEPLHCQFHHTLCANAGSTWLTRFCDELMNQAERYRFLADAHSQTKRNTLDEHKLIVHAAIGGDTTLACNLLQAHFMRTLNILEERFAGAKEIVVNGIVVCEH
ncbi:MAG TPA: GntR family transcriptional regulator [Rhodocyclaceae bacterium]|nr:GntR family transcriptional regulator [Rhodocyclaceae bacterium]